MTLFSTLPFNDERRNWLTLKEQNAIGRYPWKKKPEWFSVSHWRLATATYNQLGQLWHDHMEFAIP